MLSNVQQQQTTVDIQPKGLKYNLSWAMVVFINASFFFFFLAKEQDLSCNISLFFFLSYFFLD